MLVTTADAGKGIQAFSYNTMKVDMRKAVRELRDKLETVDVLGGGAAAAADDDEPESSSSADDDLSAETQVWTNAHGN